MTITMTVGEWRSLLLKLNESGGYPAWIVGSLIRKSIGHAIQSFDAAEELEP